MKHVPNRRYRCIHDVLLGSHLGNLGFSAVPERSEQPQGQISWLNENITFPALDKKIVTG